MWISLSQGARWYSSITISRVYFFRLQRCDWSVDLLPYTTQQYELNQGLTVAMNVHPKTVTIARRKGSNQGREIAEVDVLPKHKFCPTE